MHVCIYQSNTHLPISILYLYPYLTYPVYRAGPEEEPELLPVYGEGEGGEEGRRLYTTVYYIY